MKKYPYNPLKTLGIPVAYGAFEKEQKPPFIAFIGAGQETFSADDSYYYKENNYQIEYYYTLKDEELEERIEELLLNNGWPYEKSEDTYIQEDDMWVIYYQI